MTEEQRRQQGGESDPKSGDESPEDPARRGSTSDRPEEPDADTPERDDNVPAWFTALPPEVRDALLTGRADVLPERYRSVIRSWNLYLQKRAGRDR